MALVSGREFEHAPGQDDRACRLDDPEDQVVEVVDLARDGRRGSGCGRTSRQHKGPGGAKGKPSKDLLFH